jgi:hypothetical protein
MHKYRLRHLGGHKCHKAQSDKPRYRAAPDSRLHGNDNDRGNSLFSRSRRYLVGVPHS